jgi:hypothetical protein
MNPLMKMQHTVDIRLRLHIHETELEPGETPRDTAARLLREIMTVDDKVIAIVSVVIR